MLDALVQPDPLIGGRYQCGPVIGRGGMAEVRAGRDTRLDRPVAIKLLRADLDHQPEVRRRFEAEARMAARLAHPNVVTVFDSGEHGSRPFMVMERLPGWTLRDQLDRGRMPVPAVRALAEQVLAALAAAHGGGILHRDIKPGNILMSRDGQWKVGDFGIAKIAELQSEDDTVSGADDTATGMVRGTPGYLAPERFFGAEATIQADLYAVGAVLYEALTGHKPLQAPNPGAWATLAATTLPAPLGSVRPEVDAALATAVERSLNKAPEERFASAADMAAALSGPSGPSVEPTRAYPVAATDGLEATQPLPERERPLAQAGHRRRTLAAALAALALLSLLGAVIGFHTLGNSSGAAHHPPVPSTTPARTARSAPPSTPATQPPPTSPAASPPSLPPAAPTPTNPHPAHQHGGKGKGKGDGNSND